ncbi:hypothetical protein SNE40_012815 [Patella caerulea]|uniref:Uncharacterized protein n=1 Tax=Patella caerulea TaxID=87958 RepID=A0AAN8PW40_PATCE
MERFFEEKIVPDVIDAAPLQLLGVTYDETFSIEPGIITTPTQVQNEPTIKFAGEPGIFYTLIMHGMYQRLPIDPDAPSRKNSINGEWQHWLIVNIPEGRVSEGDVISEYIGAGPPKETGLHRYIFLLYKQKSRQDFGLPRLSCSTTKGRAKQKVREICSRYHLKNLVAGNFFQSEWDDYVPKLYAKFR